MKQQMGFQNKETSDSSWWAQTAKATPAARGFQEVRVQKHCEPHNQVVRSTTIRSLTRTATLPQFGLHRTDVQTALLKRYLYEHVHFKVLIDVPSVQYFTIHKLTKTLHELKWSLRKWSAKVGPFLKLLWIFSSAGKHVSWWKRPERMPW